MGRELLLVLISGAISFFVFLGIASFINREFNLEDMPGWVEIVLSLIAGFILYFRRGFFFSSPVISGASMGFILSILWNVKDSVFMSKFFKTVFSLRFILLVAATVLGGVRKSFMAGMWDTYLTGATPNMKLFLPILSIVIYIAGSALLLIPGIRLESKKRYSGFSMYKKSSWYSKTIESILGVVMVFVSSGLLRETILTIAQRLK